MIGHYGKHDARNLEHVPESSRALPPGAAAGPTDPRADEALMEAYVDGDTSAFRELFRRYAPMVHRAVARSVADEAQDLVQQTFLHVHRRRASFDRSFAFRPWVITIAMNLARDHLRRKRWLREHVDDLPGLNPSAPASPDAAVEAFRALAVLRDLPPGERDVIALTATGMTLGEAAGHLGTSRSTAKTRSFRGYQRLRAAL